MKRITAWTCALLLCGASAAFAQQDRTDQNGQNAAPSPNSAQPNTMDQQQGNGMSSGGMQDQQGQSGTQGRMSVQQCRDLKTAEKKNPSMLNDSGTKKQDQACTRLLAKNNVTDRPSSSTGQKSEQ